jgi:hypothetical protein
MENIISDFEMIESLRVGGMKQAALNLCEQLKGEYFLKEGTQYRDGEMYIRNILEPKIKRTLAVSWKEWITNFPNCTIEGLEDRQGGKTGEFTKEILSTCTREEFKEDKAGLFYSVNGFNPTIRSDMHRRREQGNLLSINAFFVDLDSGDKKDQMRTIQDFPYKPTFIVETKKGFHVIWRLQSGYGIESHDRWKVLQKALIARFKSDTACSDVSRLLRFPSSWHCKGLWEGGKAYFVELVYKSENIYAISDFEKIFPKAKPYTPPTKEFHLSGNVVAPITFGLTPGNRHGTLKEECSRVYARIGEDRTKAHEARELVKTWYQHACTDLKPHWEKEVDQYCDWVEINQFGGKI